MDHLNKMFTVRKNVATMLHDRGYLVADEDLNVTLDKFRDRFHDVPQKGDLTLLCPLMDDPTEKIFVFFPDAAKVGVKDIKSIIDTMQTEQVKRGIMVLQSVLTPFAKGVIAEISGRMIVECFTESELLVNITKHVLVPEHRILSAEEKDVLLKRYKVKENQLPRIQHSDPVARYYGLQRGQVVRIVRPSETAGRYVTYRWCV
ncbi:RNA polymerase Rpb5, C-terminal domain-containing protein [Scenedesmus sp. NREL 46B-D3]|nr:RNA polymerase Rpb5, C-terminal domain-containing protein [Scenedesmus sp. NREL 46B-D3]